MFARSYMHFFIWPCHSNVECAKGILATDRAWGVSNVCGFCCVLQTVYEEGPFEKMAADKLPNMSVGISSLTQPFSHSHSHIQPSLEPTKLDDQYPPVTNLPLFHTAPHAQISKHDKFGIASLTPCQANFLHSLSCTQVPCCAHARSMADQRTFRRTSAVSA